MSRFVASFLRSSRGVAGVAACLALFSAGSAGAATVEVTKSGSNYVTRLDGTQIYSGTDYAGALNAASGGTGRTINIRVGGTVTSRVTLRANTYNYYPTSERIVLNLSGPGLYGYKHAGIVLNNFRIGCTAATYGIRLSSCSGCTINNIDMDFGNKAVAVGLRVDNEGTSGHINGLTINGANVRNILAGGDRQGIETYAIDNYNINNVTADNIAGCGVLINEGNNGRIGVVRATRCGNGTTYAGLRWANNCNGATATELIASNCARGLFILNSQNITVNKVTISDCSTDTIWIQNGSNNKVLSGTVTDPDDPPVITNSPGSTITVTYRRS